MMISESGLLFGPPCIGLPLNTSTFCQYKLAVIGKI